MVIVDWGEFGSGGNGVVFEASEVVFAASITVSLLVIVDFFLHWRVCFILYFV